MKFYLAMGLVGSLICSLTACVVPVCCGPEEMGVDDFTGLWNSSTTSAQGKDIIYTRIMRNGDIIEYDFDGDNIDKGLDCYTVETGSLRRRSGPYFAIRADMHENIEFAISLKLIDGGQALEVGYLEPINEEDSGTFEPHSEVWHRVLDDRFLNNEPSCRQAP